MSKQYDLAIYIGRFQPFHVAHEKTIQQGLDIAENVLVLIGSAGGPRTIKNPWTYNERATMIHNTFQDERISTLPIKDKTYDDNQWITQVGEAVEDITKLKNVDPNKIAILGYDKDHSSFYLNYFPQWKFIEQPLYPSTGESVDATKIRQLIFNGDKEFVKGVVSASVWKYIDITMYQAPFKQLFEEWKFVQDYIAQWANSPYEPTFTTVDGIVIQSGHILLVKRGEFPGKGLWALPGGFLNPKERIKDAVLRELREETGLKVPTKVMQRAIDVQEVFDDPGRSTRGRTITHAFRITLDPTQSLPKVKGGDDAAEAKWFPLSEVHNMEGMLYEDHYHIIQHMLAQPATL